MLFVFIASCYNRPNFSSMNPEMSVMSLLKEPNLKLEDWKVIITSPYRCIITFVHSAIQDEAIRQADLNSSHAMKLQESRTLPFRVGFRRRL